MSQPALHSEGIVTSLCWEKENPVQIILKLLSLSRFTAHSYQHLQCSYIHLNELFSLAALTHGTGDCNAPRRKKVHGKSEDGFFWDQHSSGAVLKRKSSYDFIQESPWIWGNKRLPTPPEPACPMTALKSKAGTALNSQFIP